jgi:hypothetical protein
MPLNSQCPSHDERQNFCRRLRITRERKGIALATIAEATKIRATLFAGLEKNDLRGWPIAIYRRAYFREYIRIVDPDMADDWCADFNQLFTDEPAADTAPGPKAKEPLPQTEHLRLAFDTTWHGPKTAVVSRMLIAVADTGACVATGGAIAWVAAIDASTAIAVVTLTYFSLAAMLLGETPARWLASKRDAIAAAFTAGGRTRDDDAPEESPADAADHANARTWVTDARRVGPPASELRVRFKA